MTDSPAETTRLSTILDQLLDLPGEDLLMILYGLPKYLLANALEFQLRPSMADLAAPDEAPAAETRQPTERRKSRRGKTLRRAQIVFNNKMSTVDCMVKDISDAGCLLALEATTPVTPVFTLRILNSNKTRECAVTWRNQHLMGVSFID